MNRAAAHEPISCQPFPLQQEGGQQACSGSRSAPKSIHGVSRWIVQPYPSGNGAGETEVSAPPQLPAPTPLLTGSSQKHRDVIQRLRFWY